MIDRTLCAKGLLCMHLSNVTQVGSSKVYDSDIYTISPPKLKVTSTEVLTYCILSFFLLYCTSVFKWDFFL